MQILTYPHPMLSRVCRQDSIINLDDINQMFILLCEHGGLGLAAPQVGIDARFFITAWGAIFIDPKIISQYRPVKITEQCLSLPGEIHEKQRWGTIILATGQIFKDTHAIVIQHEIAHLNGRTIRDK